MVASGAVIPRSALLGEGGAGLDLALAEVLPWFLLMSAAFSIGLMDAVTAEAGDHLRTTRLDHLDQSLAEQPFERIDHARMRVATDQATALLTDTLTALSESRETRRFGCSR
jgi:alkylation response protein AidB-like acyl-CoA dehydrogenase